MREPKTIACSRWLEHWMSHLPAARAGAQPEGLHQVRVALGRLRVWLRLGGERALEEELQRLRARCGAARDLDVLLAMEPPAVLVAELRRRRAGAGEGGDRARARAGDGAGAQAGGARAARGEDGPARAARAGAAGLLERGEAAQRKGDPLALHALRRAARRLRFALEWLGEDAGGLAKLQDALGAIGDGMTALEALSSLPDARGHRAWRKRIERRIEKARPRARSCWAEVKPEVERLA